MIAACVGNRRESDQRVPSNDQGVNTSGLGGGGGELSFKNPQQVYGVGVFSRLGGKEAGAFQSLQAVGFWRVEGLGDEGVSFPR